MSLSSWFAFGRRLKSTLITGDTVKVVWFYAIVFIFSLKFCFWLPISKTFRGFQLFQVINIRSAN